MPRALYAEQLVVVDDERLTLAIDFAAIDAIESLLRVGFDTVLGELTTGEARHGLVGKVLWGLLRRHHPETTLEEAAGLQYGAHSTTVGLALARLLDAAFAAANDVTEGEANKPRPRAPRGASSPS